MKRRISHKRITHGGKITFTYKNLAKKMGGKYVITESPIYTTSSAYNKNKVNYPNRPKEIVTGESVKPKNILSEIDRALNNWTISKKKVGKGMMVI